MHQLVSLAGLLVILVGVVHSVLGERLVFNRMRWHTWIPTLGHPVLRSGHVRILWATWHMASVMGLAVGAILLHLAAGPVADEARFTLGVIAAAMAVSAALVLVATRGRHPGWVGLLAVAGLVGAGLSAGQ